MRGRALLAIIVANLIGGSTYLAQKLALQGLPPATVTVLRNAIAMACMLAWMRGLSWNYDRREVVRLGAAGVLGYALPLLLGIVGLRWSTAGNGSLLILLEPGAILVFSWLILREHLRPAQVGGVLLGLAGAVAIVLPETSADELLAGELLKGNLILALHGILWGLYSPLMLPLVRRHGAFQATLGSMVLAMALLVPAALAESDQWSAGPGLGAALAWTAGLGVIASFAGTVLWSWSLKHLSASTVAPFVFLQPAAGVAAGALVLGEAVSPGALLGGALIGTGVLLVARAPRPRPAAPGPQRN